LLDQPECKVVKKCAASQGKLEQGLTTMMHHVALLLQVINKKNEKSPT
jgi:hypothetical protein